MAFSMLSRILDDGMSARVFRTLVEDRGLAYEAFGGLDIYPDVAALVLGASCRPESTALAVEALLELAREVRESVSKEELQRVRTRVRFELDLLRDDPQAMGEILLEDEFHGEATSLDEIARRAAAVTTKDVVRVAQQFLTPEALAVVAVGRLESGVLRKLKKAARGFA
jgi:predicted Zn-dependent peptidase